jgi:hypothetical protein
MKRVLRREKGGTYYFVDGVRISGVHELLRGDVSGLRGDVSGLRGNVSWLRGDVSGLRGNVSGLRGNVSWLRGDVDDAEISDEDHELGVEVSALVIGEEEDKTEARAHDPEHLRD